MSGDIDTTVPSGKWTFDGDVTAAFSDMLQRSIPQYDVMRKAVFDIGSRYVVHGTDIVDIGCSRGEAMDPFVEKFGPYVRHVGVEVSEPMLAASRERFKSYIEQSRCVVIEQRDLRTSYPLVKASLTLSVFTLQFIPLEYRQRVLANVFKHTLPGGALILVEKVIGETAALDEAMVALYYDMKRDHGYSQDAIDRKRLSLEGVLVPVTARWNIELLRQAGFREIDCCWRWMNFAAWIAVK